jgi:DNA-binding transcriptional ArsR family regulator
VSLRTQINSFRKKTGASRFGTTGRRAHQLLFDRYLTDMFDAGQTMSTAAPELHHPDPSEIDLPSLLHALSDPARLEIVRSLAELDECPCNAIALPVSKATASHHFKVLRLAGVIAQHDEGTRRISRLRRDDLEQRFPGLLDSVLRAAQAS